MNQEVIKIDDVQIDAYGEEYQFSEEKRDGVPFYEWLSMKLRPMIERI